jgi:hypothetical protein
MKTATAVRPESDSRAELAAHIRELEEAKAGLLRAADALERGQEAVRQAEAIVGNYGDLDERIAVVRAEMVKRGNGGSLPAKLVQERNARREAEERLAECEGAEKLLADEHNAAERHLRSATEAASLEGFAVLLRDAASMADELMEANQRVWNLTHRLLAIDSLIGIALRPEQSLGLRTRMHAELKRVMDALHATEPQWVVNSANEPQALARARWKGLHTRLLADANAPITWE